MPGPKGLSIGVKRNGERLSMESEKLKMNVQEEIVEGLRVELEKIKLRRKADSKSGVDCTAFLWGLLAEMCQIKDRGDEGVVLDITISGVSWRIGTASADLKQYKRCGYTRTIEREIIKAIENILRLYEMHRKELTEDILRGKNNEV